MKFSRKHFENIKILQILKLKKNLFDPNYSDKAGSVHFLKTN